MNNVKRYEWADFARGLLMILVFIYHSEVYYYHEHSYSWIASPFFLTGFFFVSGFLFTRDISRVSLLDKCKQVFRGLVFPYFVFEAILAAPKVLSGRADLLQLTLDFFLFRGSWFIVAIGLMQLIYALVLKKKASVKTLVWSTVVFFLLGVLLCTIYKKTFPFYDIVVANRVLYSPELPNRLPFCVNLALLFCPFFALGNLCRIYEDKFISFCKTKYLLISTILYVTLYCIVDHLYIGSWWYCATGSYKNLTLMMIYALIGVWMVCCYSYLIKSIKPINYIGRNSIIFLFLNSGGLVIISLIVNKLNILDNSNYLNQLLVAFLATVLVYVASLFINRFLPLLRGDKNAFNRWSQKLGINIQW